MTDRLYAMGLLPTAACKEAMGASSHAACQVLAAACGQKLQAGSHCAALAAAPLQRSHCCGMSSEMPYHTSVCPKLLLAVLRF